MKYRLLKELPGFKVGTIIDQSESDVFFSGGPFDVHNLFNQGWIEEVKEEPAWIGALMLSSLNGLFDNASNASDIAKILSEVSGIAIKRIEELEKK